MLLENPSAIFAKLLGQQALIVVHIVISMNSIRSWHVSKNKKKGQVIKTLTLKQEVKPHNMKQDDVSTNDKLKKQLFIFVFYKQVFVVFPSPEWMHKKALLRSCKKI